MKCFESYIGVGLNCGSEISESGKYITDLPGVTLQNIDSIADKDQLTFNGVFKDVEKRAISRISKDILSFMKSQYNLKKSVKTYTTKGNLDGDDSSLNSYDGINIYSDFNYSDLTRFYVSKVYLYALEIQDTTIKIFGQGNELFSESITTAIGWNEIYINKSFDYESLNIVYDTSVFSDVPNYILDSELCGCVVEICGSCEIKNRGIFIDGLAVNYGNDTHGFKVDVSLRCMHDAIICANIDMYSDAYLYALGIELMRERIYSDRVNRFTTVDRKRAEELLTMFSNDYVSFVDTANNSIHLKDDACIECIEVSGQKYILP